MRFDSPFHRFSGSAFSLCLSVSVVNSIFHPRSSSVMKPIPKFEIDLSRLDEMVPPNVALLSSKNLLLAMFTE